MEVTLVFLGRLEDAAGGAQRIIAVEPPSCIANIAQSLEPDLCAALLKEDVRFALNGALVQRHCSVSDGDEVAFLPPVSGG
ncbi:MoaD/ThiS family protein [Croceicoccus sp. F390]|uniref:MoaD/ThiS family protein n=1 Tax=Croceicoccus esteveae TaxID=3075597 RepID=A0ABU2ZF58_9SPHN|nr:MoaD/ThiS family protein [Croceicoccus sp. F390]MDT0575243.1 MoaD/ThiS family protein [Croceicoccus sp. F390]